MLQKFALFVALAVLAGCAQRHQQHQAGPGQMQSMEEAESAMTAYCNSRYHVGLGRDSVVGATVVGAYKNSDGHLLAAACALGDNALSEEASRSVFFYDRRKHRVYPGETWWRETPCREWDPDRTSVYCTQHPKA